MTGMTLTITTALWLPIHLDPCTGILKLLWVWTWMPLVRQWGSTGPITMGRTQVDEVKYDEVDSQIKLDDDRPSWMTIGVC